jgi:hypothetical protein
LPDTAPQILIPLYHKPICLSNGLIRPHASTDLFDKGHRS